MDARMLADQALPQSLDRAIEQYGGEIIWSRARPVLAKELQKALETAPAETDPAALVKLWRPTLKSTERKLTAIQKQLAKLSPDERKSLLAELNGAA